MFARMALVWASVILRWVGYTSSVALCRMTAMCGLSGWGCRAVRNCNKLTFQQRFGQECWLL